MSVWEWVLPWDALAYRPLADWRFFHAENVAAGLVLHATAGLQHIQMQCRIQLLGPDGAGSFLAWNGRFGLPQKIAVVEVAGGGAADVSPELTKSYTPIASRMTSSTAIMMICFLFSAPNFT